MQTLCNIFSKFKIKFIKIIYLSNSSYFCFDYHVIAINNILYNLYNQLALNNLHNYYVTLICIVYLILYYN